MPLAIQSDLGFLERPGACVNSSGDHDSSEGKATLRAFRPLLTAQIPVHRGYQTGEWGFSNVRGESLWHHHGPWNNSDPGLGFIQFISGDRLVTSG